MKLPLPTLSVKEQMLEFDVWITPSLGEIRDTERFRKELVKVTEVFDSLGSASQQFKDMAFCKPSMMADVFVEKIKNVSTEDALKILQSLASVLFLVTGKSDNNTKCQLPLFLRDVARWGAMPTLTRTRGKQSQYQLRDIPIPRELKTDKYMGIVVSLASHPEHQKRLLEQFIHFVLCDDSCISQFWSIGHSYFILKPYGKEKDLLAPLVIFQVRGSVAASGGHNPEEMLRQRMLEWGLIAGADFNSSDVVLSKIPKILLNSPRNGSAETRDVENKQERTKTRAYDFILPYNVPGLQPRIFIQSQFYAGDSGSVSHKNVDQTNASRTFVIEKCEKFHLGIPRFIEYVDGAGYFSSLNGDLKTLLGMPTTTSFFQVRSASIRLRRELQYAGILTPMEIEHSIFQTDGLQKNVCSLLSREGYSSHEIKRAIINSVDMGVLQAKDEYLFVAASRREIARRYFLMDVVAIHGSPLSAATDDRLSGSLLIPGYGPFYGMKLDEVASEALRLAPNLKDDWGVPTVILRDIRWLCDQGMIMSS